MTARWMTAMGALLMALATPGAALAEDCSNEPQLRSKPGGAPTEITFRNGSDAQRRIYWIDETGRRQLKAVVEAGKTDRQLSSATHVWVVTGPKERCLYVVEASSAPLAVEIGGTGGSLVIANPPPPGPVVVTRPARSKTVVEYEPARKHKCSRHETYDHRRGECISKSSRCTRQQVYSSSMAQCIPKAAMCDNNQVYSSSLAACIPKSKGYPKPAPKPVKPVKPACKYKVDGAGNCVSPLFKSCQKAYGACIKACGGKSSCTSGCHSKYQSKCGN